MTKPRRGRFRIKEIEPCHRCGAAYKEPCRNYLRKGKAACYLPVVCPRCAAQPNECRCGVMGPHASTGAGPVARDHKGQGLLFPDPVVGFIVGANNGDSWSVIEVARGE